MFLLQAKNTSVLVTNQWFNIQIAVVWPKEEPSDSKFTLQKETLELCLPYVKLRELIRLQRILPFALLI